MKNNGKKIIFDDKKEDVDKIKEAIRQGKTNEEISQLATELIDKNILDELRNLAETMGKK